MPKRKNSAICMRCARELTAEADAFCDAAVKMRNEWEEWARDDNTFPTDGLLNAMSGILDLAGLELRDDD